eukprot:TRINITY_DN1473_c0_g1_i1.p1 TRINITY_DN1473_c0_g1~~TRINITY_DN1473_c0_g1_i1.p1  ORF type:complete len:380 (-),score=93.33 TRINITY_DN1473_c0_g1_i1:316-1455(-)
MGRKGGGRKGFFKSVQRAAQAEDQEEEPEVPEEEAPPSTPVIDQKQGVKSSEQQASSSQQPSSSKAEDFLLKDEDEDEEDEDERTEERGEETKGQMIQRHKKELRQMKEQVQRLGKKKKDEGAKLEEDLLTRQQKELDEWEAKNASADDTNQNEFSGSIYALKTGSDEQQAPKKMSKAQKRKQKQAEKEAEIEARIKEEQENMGQTLRQAEDEKFEEILNAIGLTVFHVKPDGHCMYRALAHQLNGSQYQDLRVQTAAYIRKHKDEFLPYVLGEIEEQGKEEADGDEDVAFDKYCHQVERTAAWGGQVEATALSHQLKRCIKIYSADAPTVVVGPEYEINGGILHLCYKKHAFGLGEHYDSVMEYKQELNQEAAEEEQQ